MAGGLVATNNEFTIQFIAELDKTELVKRIDEFTKQKVKIQVDTSEIKEAIKESFDSKQIEISERELNKLTKEFVQGEERKRQATEKRQEEERQGLIELARLNGEAVQQAIDDTLRRTDVQVQLNQKLRESEELQRQRHDNSLAQMQKEYEKIGKSIRNINDNNVGFLKDNDDIALKVKRIQREYEQLGQTFKSGNVESISGGLSALKTQVDEVGSSIRRVKSDSQSFADMLKENFTKFGAWSIITISYFAMIRAMGDAVREVMELDRSLVELRKVTDLSGASLTQFTKDAFEAGQEVGRTGKQVIDATAEFARSGYTIRESLNLGKEALTLLNVADNMTSVSEAATTLISILKAYNLEADKARNVTDILNQVSNTSAISFDDLAEGIQRAGAVFAQSNTSIEQLSGLLTGANEIMQNIEKTSSGLVTINQRLRG